MPSKNKIIIRDRDFSGRNNSNEYDDFEDDISDDVTKFRFAKQPKISI
jgi:hypothetical protein